MARRIGVTASEMLTMREEGMSNHDIAKALDISVPTVIRYIGKQGCRIPGLAAFRDTHPVKEEVVAVKQTAPSYEPKPVSERYGVGDFTADLDRESRCVTLSSVSGDIVFAYEDVPELVQFLVWAMRNRMEVNSDADKLKAERCEV